MTTQTKLRVEQMVNNTLNGRQWLPFGVYNSINPMSVTSIPYAATIDRTMTLIQLSVGLIVLTTNNGSNYWTIDLIDGSNSVISTFNTSTTSVNTLALKSTTSFSPTSVSTSTIAVRLRCTPTGSPGPLYVTGVSLEVSI